MLQPKNVELTDKLLLQSIMGKTDNSTYNFTTLFTWGIDGRIKYAIVEDCLVLFFYGKNCTVGATYPIGNGNKQKAAEKAYDYMKNIGATPRFILMTEEMAKECGEVFGDTFGFFADRDNADYVYETEKLITLSGKKLHQKRNHLNAFLNTYTFTYERLNQTHVPECIRLFDIWTGGLKNHSAGSAEQATRRLLENVNELGLTLGGIRVDGNLIAFSAGEAVTNDCALIHIEYADTSLRGAFNIMNQQFCQQEWSAYRYVNREEDMGIEGLRKAKMAYRPVRLIEKYFTEYKGN